MDHADRRDRSSDRKYLFRCLLLANFLQYLEAGAVPALLLKLSESFNMQSGKQGLLGGVVYLSLSIGSPFAGYLLRKFEHKTVLSTAVALNMVFTLLWALTPVGGPYSTNMFIAMRFMMGLCQCIVCVFLPLWTNENAPKSLKTTWMSYLQASVPLGVMMGYIIASSVISLSQNSEQCLGLLCWRWPFLIEVLLLTPLYCGLYFIPKEDISVCLKRGTASSNRSNNVVNSPLEKAPSAQNKGPTSITADTAVTVDNNNNNNIFESSSSSKNNLTIDTLLYRDSAIKPVKLPMSPHDLDSINWLPCEEEEETSPDLARRSQHLQLKRAKEREEERRRRSSFRQQAMSASMFDSMSLQHAFKGSSDKMMTLLDPCEEGNMFNSLPTIRWSISPKRELRSKYQSSAMLSHFDIENTDLSQHDIDPEGGLIGKSQGTGKKQIGASDSYHTADSQEPAILRSVSFPEWIIGRWSSAFSSISSSDPCIKDKDSDVTACNESTAILSLNDETSYGTTTIKSSKNTPVTSVTVTATAAAKKKQQQTHHCSDHPNSNSAATTTDAGDRAIVLAQPKKDLLQYESFKDLAPRVGVSIQKPPVKRRSSWGMFSVLRYSSSSMGRLSISSLSPEENLIWETGPGNAQPVASRKRRFYSYDDMIQVDPAVRSRDDRPASSSSPRSRSQSFTFQQTNKQPFTIPESDPSPEINAATSASFDYDCACVPNNNHPSRDERDDVEAGDDYSDVDMMSQCSSCDNSSDGSSSDDEWDSLFPDEHIRTESTDDHSKQRWHMKAYHKSRSVLGSIRALLSIKAYRYLLGVNTALYFTVTGVQFWGTKYLTVALNAPLPLVNALFILCAATGPTLGVFFGGWVVDLSGGYRGAHQRVVALELCTIFGGLACIFSLPITFLDDIFTVVALLWVVLFFGGSLLPACSGMIVSIVPREYRPTSASLSMVVFNLFGYCMALLLSGYLMQMLESHSSVCDMVCSMAWGFRLILFWPFVSLFFLVCALLASYQHLRDMDRGTKFKSAKKSRPRRSSFEAVSAA